MIQVEADEQKFNRKIEVRDSQRALLKSHLILEVQKAVEKPKALTTQEWPDDGTSELSVPELKAEQVGTVPKL